MALSDFLRMVLETTGAQELPLSREPALVERYLAIEHARFGDRLRFSWGLGPDGADSPIKGTDFAVLSGGKIRSITGFLDQVPAGA